MQSPAGSADWAGPAVTAAALPNSAAVTASEAAARPRPRRFVCNMGYSLSEKLGAAI